MCVCLCVRGARQELGGGEAGSLLQRHREKQETVGGGSRGQCQGARHQARPAGKAASGGGAGRGTRGQTGWGEPPPAHPHSRSGSVTTTPAPRPRHTTVSVPLLGRYTVSLPRPTGALTPTLGPERRIFFFS